MITTYDDLVKEMEGQPMEKQLLSLPQVCEVLEIGETTAKELVRTGELRPVRIGRALRFTAEEVKAYVRRLVEQAGAAAR